MRFLIFVCLCLFAMPVQAEKLIRLKTERGDFTLQYEVDEKRTVKIVGLPLTGTFIYNANTGTLFAHIAGESVTYAIPMGLYGHKIQTALLKKQSDWDEYLGHPSVYWHAKVLGKTCSHIFANKAAAEKARINITDLTRIQAALAYLMGPPPAGCGPYLVDLATGQAVGLPLHTIHKGTFAGETTVGITEIAEIEGEPNTLPMPTTVKLTPQAHVRFLKGMLNPQEANTFHYASGDLPWRRQITALKALLARKAESLQLRKMAK